jgi:prepilin-type N-terminal cleavage/methylation domain-containing protein
MCAPARDDRGETLIELLMTVVIMGIAVAAIVGGIGTSVLMSDIHRKQATAGAAVRDYAEAIENAVTGGGYVACATTTAYASPPGFTVPPGYSTSVASVRYWNGTGWQSGCSGDIGLQQVTIQVASGDRRASEQLTIVLREPCRLVDPICS